MSDQSPRSTSLGTQQVLADFKRRMQTPPPAASTDAAQLSYRDAAAVLHVFDPRRLRPANPEYSGREAFALLYELSEAAPGWRSTGYRSLKLPIRRAALRELEATKGIEKALAANEQRVQTPVQRMFERWIGGETFELGVLDYVELEALLALHDWELPRLPAFERVDAARRRRSTIALFEHLITPNFVGRATELLDLRRHVGIESQSFLNDLVRKIKSGPELPLVLCGPGGVGKTALLGRFLSEFTTREAQSWFPFAYLAFDSQTLDISEPFTILVAAAAQLQSQMIREVNTKAEEKRLQRIDEEFEAFRAAVNDYRNRRGGIGQRARNRSYGPGPRLDDLAHAETTLQQSFGSLLKSVSKEAAQRQKSKQVPVALFLDTFEEVQYSSIERLSGFARMINVVQETFPGLRVVIAGRGGTDQLKRLWPGSQVMRLDELETDEAVDLLGRLGVDDEKVARAVAQQVGGSPLSLRLAARVLEEERSARSGIRNLETRRLWLFSLGPELIRGQLYRRILAHIRDDGVRALAHPGMVVRRVTADVIEKVLAPACGISGVDGKRAAELFEALRSEHALVSIDSDSSLAYREDVRTPMLRLLSHERPREVTKIHRGAVDFYSAFDDVVSRAEEIYHGLMLDQPEFGRSWLSQRWMRGVESRLGSSIDELPPRARLLLASQMSIELPPEAYAAADVLEWESIFGRKAVELLRHGQAKQVPELLAERSDRTADSPLYAIEARALIASGEHESARILLQRALDNYPPLGNPGRLAELLWLRAQIEARLGTPENTLDLLWRLQSVARSLSSRLPFVQALTEEIAIGEVLKRDIEPAQRALGEMLAALPGSDAMAEPSLIRLALVRAGSEYPRTVMRLAPIVSSDLASAPPEDIERMQATVVRVLGVEPDPHRPWHEQRKLVSEALTKLFEILRAGLDPTAIEQLLELIRQEETTLEGANLAGLDDYREPWELGVSREVAA